MRKRATRAAATTVMYLAMVLAGGCVRHRELFSHREQVALERLAIARLFLQYEHPQRLVFYEGPLAESPVLGDLSLGTGASARTVRVEELRLPVAVTTITRRDIEEYFRRHADAWEAWFRDYQGSGGLVDVSAPLRLHGDTARVYVGRLCGEHCRSAWSVDLSRGGREDWRVVAVRKVATPAA